MNEPEYLVLFRELSFNRAKKRALLKHPNGLPALYFNVKRDGSVYFAVPSKYYRAFSATLWGVIAPQQKKDDTPNLMTLVPRVGREHEALVSIIGRAEVP